MHQRPHILLIGDDHDERRAIENVLIGQNYTVAPVSTMVDAEMAIADTTPNLVVIVAMSDEIVAADIYKRLKSDDATEDIPSLVVCDQDHIVEWYAGLPGVIDFVRRPCVRGDILARTRLLLRLAGAQDELIGLRKQLAEAQKMECVGALAAGVAHEFNNLMFAVMGFAEIAREKGGTDIEALRESAEISYESAKRASSVAASLLAFSRQSRAQKAMGDVNDVVTAAIRLLRRDVENAGIVIAEDLGILPETQFAAGPIQQVVLNLIINAWHALEGVKGERRISVATSCEMGSKIKIIVEDTGKGIESDKLEMIFEPFFTTKNSGNGEGRGGTGLGLSIVREVVNDHDGVVRVESDEGHGARFTVLLPVTLAEDNETADSAVAKAGRSVDDTDSKISVLIVDDEESNRKILTRLLLSHGYEACSAANMPEAMVLLWSRKIDLISMDLIMPDDDGVMCIRRIRDEGMEMPILICTGHMDEKCIDTAMDAGASGVVMKPFSAEEFLVQLHACLELATAADD